MASQMNDINSLRYTTLLKLLDKSLNESKVSFDIRQAIEQCYGEDADVFGEEMLVRVIDSMIDKANDRVKDEMLKEFSRSNVHQRLVQFESILDELDQQDQLQQRNENNDRDSAKKALDTARLPSDITPHDIIKFHAHQVMKKERDSLVQELKQLEEFNLEMERKRKINQDAMEESIKTVQQISKELEPTADLCSMVS